MTDNIIKLYELAGIEKYYLYTVKHIGKIHIAPLEGILENKHLFERNKKSKVKNTYINRVKKVYPPFTDTKQLELIKFLEKRKIIFAIFKGRLFWEFDCFNTVYSTDEDFSQALAGFVCSLWHTLKKPQKEEIKRILEQTNDR